MKKMHLLIALMTSLTILSGCYDPDEDIGVREYDIIFSQKLDGYDFSGKSKFYVSDTLLYIDEDERAHKIPGDNQNPDISVSEAKAMVEAVKNNMLRLGWNLIEPGTDLSSEDVSSMVFMSVTASKVTYIGGGYYPGWGGGWYYPGWGGWYYPGWGYWGWEPWIPYYYSYETGTVSVTMVEALQNSIEDDQNSRLVWETILNGYISNSFDLQVVVDGIDQGFEQSERYLQR